MKLLYIAPKSPIPTIDGGTYAMRSMLTCLTHIAEIDGVLLETQKHPISEQDYQEVRSYFQELQTIEMDTRIHAFRAFSSLISGINYNLSRFKSPQLRALFNGLSNNQYDAILLDGLFAAAEITTIQSCFQCPIILRTHNVEHRIWHQKSKQSKNPFKRFYFKNLAKSLRKEEIEILKQANQIWTISSDDHQFFKELHPAVFDVPVAIDPSTLEIDSTQSHCFHLGAMNWKPNQEAVAFLTDEIWKSYPDLGDLRIAGSFSDKLPPLSDTRIHFLGRIDDLNAFYSTGGILVSPIFHGSGIRIKCLEALSLGIPCITTTLGATGISSDSGIVLAETKNEFYECISELQKKN
jgi:glycosyltransferase involved in cell wall biosynthesis